MAIYNSRSQPYQRRTQTASTVRRPYSYSGHGAYTRAPTRVVTKAPYRRASGRGAYNIDNGPWANRGADLGGHIGQYYGGSTGRAIGSWIGRRAAHYPAKIFGSGSYHIGDGSSEKYAPVPPKFENDRDGVVISHREYLGDLITSSTVGGLKLDTFDLNPSSINTFPWLSQLAGPNFQQYRFDGLIFEFKSFSADALNSTNTALGAVFSAINYDYNDSNFTSRNQIENSDWSTSVKPSEGMLIPVECAPRLTGLNGGLLYVLNTPTVPLGADPKTYMLGKMTIGTKGFQGTSVNVGSLYVTYKIRLYKPIMLNPLSSALVYNDTRTGISATSLWGGARIPHAWNSDSIGCTVSGNIIHMSKTRLQVNQVFELKYLVVGTAVAGLVVPTFSMSPGITGWSLLPDTAGNPFTRPAFEVPANGSTTDMVSITITFIVLDDSADHTIEALMPANLPTASMLSLSIYQISGALADPGTIGMVPT